MKKDGRRATVFVPPRGEWRGPIGSPCNSHKRTKRIVVLCWVVFFTGLTRCVSQSNPDRQAEIESLSRQAAQYLKDNKPNLAVPALKATVALDPSNVDARGNLGVVFFFQGQYADAIPQLRAALKLRPNLWKIQALLGIGEKRTGDITAGRRDLEEAFPKVRDKKVRIDTGMELIEVYSWTGDLDKAAAVVADLRKVDRTNASVLYTAYRIYSDLAAESMLSLSLIDPNSARMHQAMAHELAKRGNAAEAIEHYRTAIRLDPQLPGIHFELAEMLTTLSTTEGREEAEKEYKEALKIDPFDEQAQCRLGDIALLRGDFKEANERYSKAVKLQPDDAEANVGLAKVFMTMGQPQTAEPLLQHALKLDPTNALAHFRLSTVYRLTGRTTEAKKELAEYQKYKQLKEKLRTVYHDLHEQEGTDENEDSNPKR